MTPVGGGVTKISREGRMYGWKMVQGTNIQMIVAKGTERRTEESVMGKTVTIQKSREEKIHCLV